MEYSVLDAKKFNFMKFLFNLSLLTLKSKIHDQKWTQNVVKNFFYKFHKYTTLRFSLILWV